MYEHVYHVNMYLLESFHLFHCFFPRSGWSTDYLSCNNTPSPYGLVDNAICPSSNYFNEPDLGWLQEITVIYKHLHIHENKPTQNILWKSLCMNKFLSLTPTTGGMSLLDSAVYRFARRQMRIKNQNRSHQITSFLRLSRILLSTCSAQPERCRYPTPIGRRCFHYDDRSSQHRAAEQCHQQEKLDHVLKQKTLHLKVENVNQLHICKFEVRSPLSFCWYLIPSSSSTSVMNLTVSPPVYR